MPPARLTWYWQLQGSVRTEPVAVTDRDGLDNSAATVAALHRRHQHVICYIDVGTWENWRSDAGRFPRSVLGSNNGWPGERWLDVRQLSAPAPIMRARFATCARKHFDAVEPDNMDGFENGTGFPITRGQQLAYDDWVARTVHGMGMAVFEKNLPELAGQLQPHFDGVLEEQCNQVLRMRGVRALSAGAQAGAQRGVPALAVPGLLRQRPQTGHLRRPVLAESRRLAVPAVPVTCVAG
ncbi:MAG TPA: endo alpha-1,4 polygalactosaminidase [Solirubrobacteraceae bacterium]|nr:endo alpha-1,4 polygalactosaminidase [Solirubrobacteraceae bacterium]